MTFQYHPDAAKELLKSVEYYEDKSEGLGAEFLNELEGAIAKALAHPQSGSLLTDQERRILLVRFPYEITINLSSIQNQSEKPF
jgi:plasmid stabilization system protein ParE